MAFWVLDHRRVRYVSSEPIFLNLDTFLFVKASPPVIRSRSWIRIFLQRRRAHTKRTDSLAERASSLKRSDRMLRTCLPPGNIVLASCLYPPLSDLFLLLYTSGFQLPFTRYFYRVLYWSLFKTSYVCTSREKRKNPTLSGLFFWIEAAMFWV